MFQKLIHFIRKGTKTMQNAMNLPDARSGEMQSALALWQDMFRDDAPWKAAAGGSLGLASAVAGELARLTTIELECTLTGSERADYLRRELQPVLSALRPRLELGLASGGLVFKPYPDGNHIAVDCVPAWRFTPTAFNSRGEITGAAFPEQVTRGGFVYTRLETHDRTAEGYRIRNLAYRSRSAGSLGTPCRLDEVDEWATLAPEAYLRFADGTVPEGMLFSFFRVPFANTVDPASPLGMSVFGRAAELIEQADRQYGRILWEYEGSELAVDASLGALPEDGRLPRPRARLFRELDLAQGAGGDLYQVFSPAIRDESLFNGLNQLLRRIEFACSLAYGTLSDPQNVDRTAAEIRVSEQRSYAAVCDLQHALQTALEELVRCMDLYATLYDLAPAGAVKPRFLWGDGVLQDAESEFARRKALADSGYLRPEKLLAWYFGVSDTEAVRELLPERQREEK